MVIWRINCRFQSTTWKNRSRNIYSFAFAYLSNIHFRKRARAQTYAPTLTYTKRACTHTSAWENKAWTNTKTHPRAPRRFFFVSFSDVRTHTKRNLIVGSQINAPSNSPRVACNFHPLELVSASKYLFTFWLKIFRVPLKGRCIREWVAEQNIANIIQ